MSFYYSSNYQNLYVANITGPLNGLPLGPTGSIGPQGPTGVIGPTGPDSVVGGLNNQIAFNQSGSYTGSNNLIFRNEILQVNYLTGSSGSFNNLLLNNSRIRLGTSAGQTSQGNNSVSIGPASGFSNQNIDNVAIGNSAGNTNQGTGVGGAGKSVAIGYIAGQTTQGYSSVAIGQGAGQSTQGDFSVAIGTSSGNITQGTRSVSVGQGCGYNTQGAYSVAIGDSAGQNFQATESIAIGRSAALQSQYLDSISIGAYAGQNNQGTGTSTLGRSIAIGNHAGENFQRNQSIAIGDYAGNLSQGQYSIAIGLNAGLTNQASSSIILNASGNNLNSTGSGLFIEPISNKTGPNVVFYNAGTKELSYSNQQFYVAGDSSQIIFNQSGSYAGNNNLKFNTDSSSLLTNYFTGGTGSFHNLTVQDTLSIGSANVGQIYFSTGNYTGCFISNLRYNATGDHYIYYNSRNKELVQVSPVYFFSYNTTTQIFTGPNIFYPVGFNTNNILYHTFQHTTGSSIFTGTFQNTVTVEFTYSLQLHSTTNNTHIGAAVLYLDGNPIPGSYRSASVTDTGGEYCLTNTLLVTIPAGGHTIELRAAVDNTNLQLGGTPVIPAPGNSYSSVNLKCSRII